jgi:TonB family protein
MYSSKIICVVVVSAVGLAIASDGPRVGYPALDVFRLQAILTILPTYPASSVSQNRSGTAVAEILVSQAGKVVDLRILEAPDAAISASVTDAVTRWTFHPLVTGDNVSHPMKGRLIFYFKINKGKPIVIDVIAQRLAKLAEKVPR